VLVAAPPQMRSRIVGLVLSYVRARGGDADGILRAIGLPASAEKDEEVVLGLPALHAFLDAAERESKDPFLGVHIAREYRRGIFGVMEYACRSAPDLREALMRIVRFASLMNDLVEITYEEDGGTATIEQRIAVSPLGLGRHANEFFAAGLLEQSFLLCGQRCVPERVWFKHPKPRSVGELEKVFGTDRITFDAAANGAAIAARFLDLPVITSDPPLLGVLDRHAEDALAQRPAVVDFVAQVRARVGERLRDAPPALETIAGDLGLSPRTLQRRLTTEGTSFQKLLESAREELARTYVKEGAMPIADIALRLGYADSTAFLRAFKRWTGKTPKQFRGE
jgi:AraC-like DNA-binding protein